MSFRYSANLGFLWRESPLADAIRAAVASGFDAVECHFPYDQDLGAARRALDETGAPMLSLNCCLGDPDEGQFGIGAAAGRAAEARASVDRGLAAADALGARMLHVMAGRVGDAPAAREAFLETLSYACAQAPHGLTVLIEPINRHDVPGYHLHRLDQAAEIIRRLGAPNLALMFDAYHAERTEPPAAARLAEHISAVAHIQIAGTPDRGEPDRGAADLKAFLREASALGYCGHIGAEYKPRGALEAGLGWLSAFRVSGL